MVGQNLGVGHVKSSSVSFEFPESSLWRSSPIMKEEVEERKRVCLIYVFTSFPLLSPSIVALHSRMWVTGCHEA